jgi:hypothetical protein
MVVTTDGIQGWQRDSTEVITPATPILVGTRYLAEWSFSGGTMSCKVNAWSTQSVASGNVSSLAGTLALGHAIASGAFFKGRIASVIVCGQALGAGHAQAARAYLSSKYGLPV